jgi:NAD(P)-dependent dehydrogenase (short-subunit alcohol dehydrogenase family)
LAQNTLDAFGGVHLLFNNAGVGAGSTIWDSTLEDWQWVMGVNLWGVIYGIRVFVPIMLAQDTECHIVNTASIAGLLPNHPSAAYLVTKRAVVALSEHLYYSLADANAKIKASVLCPSWVNTRILDSGRNRPPELQNEESNEPLTPEMQAAIEWMHQAVEKGMPPNEAADLIFDAIKAEQFYILTDDEFNYLVEQHMENILHQRNPTLVTGS